MFKDKSGMFNDFGFKLIVINTLLEEDTSFTKELEEMKEKYVDNYDGDGYECIPEMVNYFENLVLTKEDLEKVEILYFMEETKFISILWNIGMGNQMNLM